MLITRRAVKAMTTSAFLPVCYFGSSEPLGFFGALVHAPRTVHSCRNACRTHICCVHWKHGDFSFRPPLQQLTCGCSLLIVAPFLAGLGHMLRAREPQRACHTTTSLDSACSTELRQGTFAELPQMLRNDNAVATWLCASAASEREQLTHLRPSNSVAASTVSGNWKVKDALKSWLSWQTKVLGCEERSPRKHDAVLSSAHSVL